MMQLEICVDSVESAIAAQAGGAQRIELCSALSEGGLTPSIGLIQRVRASINIGLFVMIRPRSGDFLYAAEDIAVMQQDITQAAQSGADGVVFGLLNQDGDIDQAKTRQLIESARPMAVTFHRAIDMARDLDQAFAAVLQTGADRVLTSGGSQTALLGAERIAKLVRIAAKAAPHTQLMVCGGVRAHNVNEIASRTGATQFHAAVSRKVASTLSFQHPSLHLGSAHLDDYARKVVVAQDVQALRWAIDASVRTSEKALA